MPAGIAPWIQAADPAQHMAQGLQIGSQIAQANAHLQQQAAAAAAEAEQRRQQLEIRRQENERQAQLDQQKIEIEKAYRQQQVGMEQMRLNEAKRVNDLKVMQAAQTFQAQNKYQTDYQTMVDQGIEPGSASIKAALQNPGFLRGGTGLAAVARAQQAAVPKELEVRQEGAEQFYRSSPTERYQHIPKGTSGTYLENKQVDVLNKKIARLEAELPTNLKGKKKEEAEAPINALKQQVNTISENRGHKPFYPEVESTSNEVIRMTKDGRRAVFDAATKKFLRYADE